MKKTIVFAACLFAWRSLSLWAGPASVPQGLQYLTSQALKNNPELSAMAFDVLAARSGAGSLMPLMDPMASFEYMSLPIAPPDMGEPPMKEMRFSLTQTIPFPGKIASGRQERLQSAAVAQAEYELMAARMRRDLEVMYGRIAVMDRTIEIARRKIDQRAAIERLVKAAYESGRATAAEFARAGIMRIMAENELKKGSVERETMLVSLSRMAGLPALPSGFVFEAPSPPDAGSLSVPDLLERARASNAGVRLESARLALADRSLDSARWELAPDFEVGATIGLPGNGGATISFMAGMSLPLFFFARQVPEIGMAENMRASAERKQAAAFAGVAEAVRTDAAVVAGDLEILKRFDGIVVPEGERAMTLSFQAYAAGKLDFRGLADQAASFFDSLAEREMVRAEIIERLADLEFNTEPAPVN